MTFIISIFFSSSFPFSKGYMIHNRLVTTGDYSEKRTFDPSGITFKLSGATKRHIDWGAQIAYKLTNRMLIGAGGVYRMGVSEKYWLWVNSAGIYGYRVYADFNLVKRFLCSWRI